MLFRKYERGIDGQEIRLNRLTLDNRGFHTKYGEIDIEVCLFTWKDLELKNALKK